MSLLIEQEEMRESAMGDSQEEELDVSHFLTSTMGEAEKGRDDSVSDSMGVRSGDCLER